MENISLILWTILGIALIVAEIFTLGFVLFWFGIGALAAALAGYLGLGIFWQFLIFAVVSLSLTAMSRTIFSHRLALGEGADYKTNIDTLPGKIGTVTIASLGTMDEGEVKVYGSIWKAFPVDGESPLMVGEKVEVVRVEGATIYVKKAVEELPGWREESGES
jgi:membrane protein implicated in regulation of membrane protease activity